MKLWFVDVKNLPNNTVIGGGWDWVERKRKIKVLFKSSSFNANLDYFLIFLKQTNNQMWFNVLGYFLNETLFSNLFKKDDDDKSANERKGKKTNFFE